MVGGMWPRGLPRLRRERAQRDRELDRADLGDFTRMPWVVRLRMFLTGRGAVDHREDLRGRWLLHRKLLVVAAAALLAWLAFEAAACWQFLEG